MSTVSNQTSDSQRFLNCRVGFVGKLGGVNRKEARRLVRENGGVMVDPVDATVELIVLGADQSPIDGIEQLMDSSMVEAVNRGDLTVITETELWQQLGLVDNELDAHRLYTPAMLAQLLNVSITTIRRWHRRGLIKPTRQVKKLPYFDFQEVASAQRIAKLISSGASATTVESKLTALANLFPDVERPLSQLSVIVEGKNVLLRSGEGLVEPGGQRLIDFESDDGQDQNVQGESVLSLAEFAMDGDSMIDFTTPDEFLALAIECEDANDLDSAMEVYRALSLAFGPTSDACFRMAELLYQQQDLNGARERYYMAVELDESFVEARSSLGCVLVDLGHYEFAYSAFKGALEHHADYPDVQYHMARLLDEMDRSNEAENHWQNFLQLAPKSPWADEARERLGL